MRYAILLGAFLLAGIGLILHRPSEIQRRPQQPIPWHQDLRQEVLAMPDSAEPSVAGRPAILEKCPVPETRVENKGSTSGLSSASGWRKTSVHLERPLALTALQRAGVDEVLRQRQEEIQELHAAIRTSGILDIRSFEWRVSLLKADWYRKIDGLLDAPQHEKFVAMVENGLFNEGLAFTVEPGMTILE